MEIESLGQIVSNDDAQPIEIPHVERTSVRLCSRCHARPRQSPKQRWCRVCANQFKVARYWQRKATEEPRSEELMPAPAPTEKPMNRCWQCGTVSWFELESGLWRCRICGLTPTGERG
jgi:hypothetical protein